MTWYEMRLQQSKRICLYDECLCRRLSCYRDLINYMFIFYEMEFAHICLVTMALLALMPGNDQFIEIINLATVNKSTIKHIEASCQAQKPKHQK